MPKATFRHGDPLMVPYTPATGNVAAGDVVLLGNTTGITCGIAHLDIPNGVLGDLAVGGGVYEVTNLNNAANYTKVYWDNTNSKVTTTSTNNAQFGYLTEKGGGGANTTCLVEHFPKA